MRITLDVSAAVEVVIGGKKQKEIKGILYGADWVIAPSLFIYEITNVMWKYHKYQGYSQELIIKKIQYLYEMVDHFIEANSIFEEALPFSCKINHSAYDAMYLVVSRRKNSKLVTLDKKLIETAKKTDIPVLEIK